MPRIKRIMLLSVAGLALLGTSSYLIAFKATGSGSHDTADKAVAVHLVPVDLPGAIRGYGFFDVALADGEMWAVGYNGRDPKLVYHSRDYGTTWETISVPSPGFTLKRISFPDVQNGWAVGGYGTIMHTSDGGRTWEQLKRPTEADLVSVTFVNAKVGYIGGSKALFDRANDRYTYGVVILRTTDGGQSWRTCYEDDRSEYVGRIHALSDAHALVSVDRELITEDGGKTWQPVQADRADLGSIAFTADGTGYAVSRSGNFYRSLDKGKSWRRLDVPQSLLQRQWWSIDFADANRGLAVGNGGAVALTEDGGKTWSEITTPIQDNLMEVRLRDGSGLILGSRNVYRL
jgi:photosystem II stability/assembly factor-like uncharacterized protein